MSLGTPHSLTWRYGVLDYSGSEQLKVFYPFAYYKKNRSSCNLAFLSSSVFVLRPDVVPHSGQPRKQSCFLAKPTGAENTKLEMSEQCWAGT